jgi:hypothetical protein
MGQMSLTWAEGRVIAGEEVNPTVGTFGDLHSGVNVCEKVRQGLQKGQGLLPLAQAQPLDILTTGRIAGCRKVNGGETEVLGRQTEPGRVWGVGWGKVW